jgi:hypothetical protein
MAHCKLQRQPSEGGFVVECGAGVAREGLQDWGMSSFFFA